MRSLRLDPGVPDAYPVELGLLKDQLRILDDQFDPLLDIHLYGAMRWAEGIMHRSILSRTATWIISDFPRDTENGVVPGLRLPRGKTQSVASVAYVQNGSTTTLTGPTSGSPVGTGYREDLTGDGGGLLWPPYNESWPAVDLDAPAPVTITFSAGWTAAQVPSSDPLSQSSVVKGSSWTASKLSKQRRVISCWLKVSIITTMSLEETIIR